MITQHRITKIEQRKRLVRVDVLHRGTKDEENVEHYQPLGWAITLNGNITFIVPDEPPFKAGDIIHLTWSKKSHVVVD